MNVLAVFIASFTDNKVLWIPIAAVDATQHRMGGTLRIVKSRSDIEPVIDIPIASMRSVEGDKPLPFAASS